jgi:hypothetical protein
MDTDRPSTGGRRSSPVTYRGPLLHSRRYPDVKDPSLTFDGERWHLFATGCGMPGGLEIFHATAPAVEGPWTEHDPPVLDGVDMIANPAAPGVIADGRVLHLFLQHDFNVLDGALEHLVSLDGGATFTRHDTALRAMPGTGEAGIYDPDPAVVDGEPHLTYAGMSVIGEPDLYLARSRSGTWSGPWERLGRILGHEEVEFHNQVGHDDYEWGLEGPHLVQLPDGRALLTAVCFLHDAGPGHRQRLLLCVADDVVGPYRVIGPVLEPASDPPGEGENGHGGAVVVDDRVQLTYQERHGDGRPWHIRRASIDIDALETLASPGDRASRLAG